MGQSCWWLGQSWRRERRLGQPWRRERRLGQPWRGKCRLGQPWRGKRRLGQPWRFLGQPVLATVGWSETEDVAGANPGNTVTAIPCNIPVALIARFRGRKMIVRTHDPLEIVENVGDEDLADISFVQLLSLNGKIDSLMGWGNAIPVELVVSDTCRDLPLLYRYAPLLAVHPVRVSVPLAPGFGKVAKLALSLNLAVKLEGGQPEASMLVEMHRMALLYLHQSTVSEPIEFFHSLFLAFYHRHPISLWTIQEENPSLVRHITDTGEETMPGRLAGMGVPADFSAFVQEMQRGPAGEEGECAGCEFRLQCQGYFKWPLREYRCAGVQELLRTLRGAAEELRTDIASFHAPGGGGQR